MNNNELMNKRVQEAKNHVQDLLNILDEVSLLTVKSSYLNDVAQEALSQLAMVRYRLDVMDSLTEKIEA